MAFYRQASLSGTKSVLTPVQAFNDHDHVINMEKKDPSSSADHLPVPVETITWRICVIRGQKVMLDFDLADLYQVPTKRLNEAVKRNIARFPDDFMFQLNKEELENWRSQFATSNSRAKMGLRRPPYAFTELGVAMLSSVLNSDRAIQMNILIMRAFVKMRELLATHKDLAIRIEKLEAGFRDHTIAIGLLATDIEASDKKVTREFKKLQSPRRRKPRIDFLTEEK